MPLIASLVLITITLAALPVCASAWNIPGHMVSAAIAYQFLQQENPQTIEKVKAVLAKHPWYANQWQARLQDVPIADRDMVLFMQAARWADDIRMNDKQHHRASWHYINWPFKPDGQPGDVYAAALDLRAAAIVFVHNHPSGDSAPSQEDVEITRRLKECGEMLAIRVLDHCHSGR